MNNNKSPVLNRKKTNKDMELILVLFLSFGLLSSLILPSVTIGGVSIYIVTLISPVIFFLVLFFWLNKPPSVHPSAFAPLALAAMVLVSASVSWTIGLSSVNQRDVIEAVKYAQFFSYLLAIAFLSSYSLRVIHYFILVSAFVFLILGYIQVLQVPVIAEWLSILYLGPNSSHIDSVLSGHRITITGTDPNIGGVISSFFCAYFSALFYIYGKNRYALISILFFYLCFATQSRTALISLIVAMSFYYLLFYGRKILIKIWLLMLSLTAVVFLVFYLDLSYVYTGIQYAFEGKNNSLNVRFDNIYIAFQRFLEYPIFGMGPMKLEVSTIIDSEYALILQRYGLLGIIVFGAYLYYLYKLALRNIQSHWGVTLLIFTVMSLLIMITNNIFSGYQLMSLVILLNIACVLNFRNETESKRILINENCPSNFRPPAI